MVTVIPSYSRTKPDVQKLEWEKIDSQMDGFTTLCEAIKSSAVATFNISECHIGPGALSALAGAIGDTHEHVCS